LIERAYSADVLNLFPEYGCFWQKFIGVKSHSDFPGRIFSYGLRFPSDFEEGERTHIGQVYEEITMAHYSLFCHLAGAHFQIRQLERTIGLSNPQTNQIEHWEAFEVTYLHLGIVFNETHHLWNLLATLKDASTNSGTQLMKNVLVAANKPKIYTEFEQLEIDIKARRNNVTHYSRGASWIWNGKLYVPLKQTQNTPWTVELQGKEWIETLPKAKTDLRYVEITINSIHAHLIELFETFLNEKRILVDYEEST
jgi:hypothetical protein